ncbi:MAG: hypothetical protein IJ225_06385 [Solobacterium sp.]|nr:hypothetical protein [Solobacterium sp.]
MDYRTKCLLNEGVILLSYAYAVSGYIPASLTLGITGAVLAILWHSPKRFLNNLSVILTGTLIQVLFLFVSDFSGLEDTIVLLAFCNMTVSSLWMESSRNAVLPTIRILSAVFPLILFLSLALPDEAILFLNGSLLPRISALVLDMMIFLPMLVGQAMRGSRRRVMVPEPTVFQYNASYDKLARTSIHKGL